MAVHDDSNEDRSARPARVRRKEARPGDLLKAAIIVFARAGFHSASVDEIGALAGVSKSTVYFYFETKERLFTEAVRHGTESLFEKTGLIVADEQASAPMALQRLVSSWNVLITGQSTKAVLKLLLTDGSSLPPVARCAERFFERMHALIQSLVERGIRNGEFRACDATMVARIILATLCTHGLKRCLPEQPGAAAEPGLHMHIDLVLRGLTRRQEN